MAWPSTWTDRRDRDRTPSVPGHELAGVVTALGYGTTGLSVRQRVFGLTDWYRDGTLAEYVAIEARKYGDAASLSGWKRELPSSVIRPSRSLRDNPVYCVEFVNNPNEQ